MSTDATIKVMIVDDHAMVRHGLTVLLEAFDEFKLIAEAHNGQMALTLCSHYQPDVILMDLLMPGMSGIEAIRLILASYPQIKIIVLSSNLDEILLQDALQAGAIGYLLKTGTIDEVAEAVRRAYHGKPSLDPQAVSTLISVNQHPPPKVGYDLSRREREVLALMIVGLTNRKIGEQLFISTSTVKNHIVNIFTKLNVDNRTKAIALALRAAILEAN